VVKCTYFKHIQRFFNIFLIVLTLSGCGADEEQKVDDAIDIALSYLTAGDNQRAIQVLEDVGRHPKNYRYVKTLATAYAGRGGYLTTKFFADDLALVNPSPGGGAALLNTFALFSTSSSMDSADDPDYEDLMEAINILLFAGGITTDKNPTSARRLNYFSAEQVSNMNMLLLYLSFVELGKYVHFYGSADAAGTKGAEAGAINSCFLNYTGDAGAGSISLVGGVADLEAYLGTNGGACGSAGTDATSTDLGNPFLGSEGNLNITRVCQGVILLNTFFDSLTNVIDQLAGDDFGSLGGTSSAIDTLRSSIITAFPATADAVIVQSQDLCESIYEGDTDALEVYFAFFFEGLFQ
jgi:hypothetical protein